MSIGEGDIFYGISAAISVVYPYHRDAEKMHRDIYLYRSMPFDLDLVTSFPEAK